MMGAVGPLDSVRILDLTHAWAGPLAGRILADLGADVIKVEARTSRGPATAQAAQRGAVRLAGDGTRPWNQQGPFNKLNRNRRSICIDLKRVEGRDIFLKLVTKSDIVLENFSAGVMERLGLGYASLKAANRSIIYISMSGYGSTGPYRDYVAFGPNVEGLSGLAAVMGYGDGVPRISALAVADAIAGTFGAAAAATELATRRYKSAGSSVDLSMLECTVNMFGDAHAEYEQTGQDPFVAGTGHRDYAPHGTYQCAGDDDWIVIAARDDVEWRSLACLIDEAWTYEERFVSSSTRLGNRAELDALIERWTLRYEKLPLMERLQSSGVPAGAVLNARELVEDIHLRDRGFFVDLYHRDTGTIRYPGTPVKIDGLRSHDWLPAPGLGEHNLEILTEILDLEPARIRELTDGDVLSDRPPGLS